MRKYEMVDINRLIPYEKNARTHSAKQIERIANSIEEFGFINPVLIDENYMIIAGHGRVEAGKYLGIPEVPCLFVEDLSEAQKRAYILADNKLAEDAGWDDKILKEEILALDSMGFDVGLAGFDIDDFYEESKDFEDDDFDADKAISQLKETKAKRGDIYQLGNHRLMCGDSTDPKDVDALCDGLAMDMCLTDPPYNVNYGDKAEMLDDYQKGHRNTQAILNDNMDDANFYQFLFDFYTQMLRVLKAGGAFYIFHAESEGLNFRKALADAGVKARQTLIWVKNCLVLGRQDYQWRHEPILYGWKDGDGHYFTNDRTETTVFEEEIDYGSLDKKGLIEIIRQLKDEREPNTILHENKPIRNDVHPTMKPVKLCQRLIRNSSREREREYWTFSMDPAQHLLRVSF